jgi:CRP-like cAMP-binding protein
LINLALINYTEWQHGLIIYNDSYVVLPYCHGFIKLSPFMFNEVKTSILTFGYFSEEELALITSRLRPITIQKGDHLIEQGAVCQTFFFVNAGNFRQYELLETGEEAVLNLFVAGDWVLEYKSFVSQSPAASVTEALQNSEVLALSLQDFHDLIRISPGFFRLGHILEQATQRQDYRQARLSPEEKYARLLQSKPQIIQQFPLKLIASFLAITPETLSRVRRRLIS